MSVLVVGYRHRIEPAELGDCQDPDCPSVAAAEVLLVASYSKATIDTGRDHEFVRVCGDCDERRLLAWFADES